MMSFRQLKNCVYQPILFISFFNNFQYIVSSRKLKNFIYQTILFISFRCIILIEIYLFRNYDSDLTRSRPTCENDNLNRVWKLEVRVKHKDQMNPIILVFGS